MRPAPFLSGLALGLVPWVLAPQDGTPPAPEEPPPQEAFTWGELTTRLATMDTRYLAFLDRSTLSAGLYSLPVGVQDGQAPHALDEVYYVAAGRARFTAAGVERGVQPGDVLFVTANAEHRFHDIEEDLELLVLFSKAPPPAPGGRAPDSGD